MDKMVIIEELKKIITPKCELDFKNNGSLKFK